MKCNNPQCQKDMRPEWKVCPFCQTPVAGKCVNCGEKLKFGWAVCPFCQTPVEKQQQEALEKLEKQQREALEKLEKQQREELEKQREAKRSLGITLDPQGRAIEWYVGPDEAFTWDGAKRYTESLIADGGGWRLPTIKELKGLYEGGNGVYNLHSDFKVLYGKDFFVWSCEIKKPSSVLIFNFIHGLEITSNLDYVVSKNGRLFAVRSRR